MNSSASNRRPLGDTYIHPEPKFTHKREVKSYDVICVDCGNEILGTTKTRKRCKICFDIEQKKQQKASRTRRKNKT